MFVATFSYLYRCCGITFIPMEERVLHPGRWLAIPDGKIYCYCNGRSMVTVTLNPGQRRGVEQVCSLEHLIHTLCIERVNNGLTG
jgi:hypothetical protein